jgi:tRNA pseudouridine13 synthase
MARAGEGMMVTADEGRWVFRWDALGTRLPPVGAQAVLSGQQLTDFRVEEIAAYAPSGSGEHVMVWVEKAGVSTMEVARRLASAVGCPEREVGFAGRKDVHATVMQWFTVPRRKARLEEGPLCPGVTIRRLALHKNKLQLGHLHGNRFLIVLRAPVDGALDTLRVRQSEVARGVPNYFGPQRFGVGGRNAVDGLRVLSGNQRGGNRRGLQLLTSAVQSHIFNAVASRRLAEDRDVRPLLGDLLVKVPTGAPFWCDEPEHDAERVHRGEVAVTGPMPGARMRSPKGHALTVESRILGEVLPDPRLLTEGPRAPFGDRRPILVRPTELRVEPADHGVTVGMCLPAGSFATAVLREWAGITMDFRSLGGSGET